MTAACSTAREPGPNRAQRWRRSSFGVSSERGREWLAKGGIAAACAVLCLATAIRFVLVLEAAPSGLDALSAAWLFALVCRAAFYILVCWFTLIRCPAVKRTTGLAPRATAFLGTFLVLGFGLLPPARGLAAGWHLAAALLYLVSAGFAILVLMKLGRSLSIMPEARRLVVAGPYRVIRHPLYLVEELAALAGFIEAISPWAALLLVAQIACQLRRIANEEAVLETAFPAYSRYKASTARMLPGVW